MLRLENVPPEQMPEVVHIASELYEKDKELAAGLAWVQPGVLKCHPDLAPHPVGVGRHVDAGHPSGARRDRGQGGEHADGGRFPCAVRPQEPEHFPGSYVKVDPPNRLNRVAFAVERLDELMGFHRESHGLTLRRAADTPAASESGCSRSPSDSPLSS